MGCIIKRDSQGVQKQRGAGPERRRGLKTRLTDISKQIKTLEGQRARTRADCEKIILQVSEAIDYIRRIPREFRSMPGEYKARLLREITSRIVVRPDGVEIEWAGIYRSILAPQIQEISSVRNLPQLRARMGCLRTAVKLEVDRLLCAA